MNTVQNILFAPEWYDINIHRGVAKFACEKQWHLNANMAFDHQLPYKWQGHGIISLFSMSRDFCKRLVGFHLPWVDLSLKFPEIRIPRIVTDNELIGKTAAEYYLKKGFKHFAFYGRASGSLLGERWQSFRHHLEKNGENSIFQIDSPVEFSRKDWMEMNMEVIRQLSCLPKPLAVFAPTDRGAVAILEACIFLHVDVPNEISVLGVNNTALLCETLAVPLSSIDVDHARIGYTAAEHLSYQVEGKRSCDSYIEKIPPLGVVERQSTDAIGTEHKKIQQAVGFISRNYKKPISVPEIAREVSMSQRGLEIAFKKYLNDTPGKMLKRKRLQYSSKLLRKTDLTLEAIAGICGYSSGTNFSAAYKRFFGHSPAQDRS